MTKPLCEHTIRACIEALPRPSGVRADIGTFVYPASCKDALEALLPKKDRAKELVEAFDALSDQTPWMRPGEDGTECFARWLVANNLINEKGAL